MRDKEGHNKKELGRFIIDSANMAYPGGK